MADLNFDKARYNMIEQQIRPWEVLDQRVLDAIATTPREEFVPRHLRNLAFVDMELPIGAGQTMMAPKMEARLVQALDLQPSDMVLEVGTGTGYLTALLARLAHHVYSVDILADLREGARHALARHGITNITIDTADGSEGLDSHAPYDVIVLTGSVPELPEAFRRQLRVGGRIFAVIGSGAVMTAHLITRLGEGEWADEELFETCITPLRNVPSPQRFVF